MNVDHAIHTRILAELQAQAVVDVAASHLRSLIDRACIHDDVTAHELSEAITQLRDALRVRRLARWLEPEPRPR
jgi:hypothetical protein